MISWFKTVKGKPFHVGKNLKKEIGCTRVKNVMRKKTTQAFTRTLSRFLIQKMSWELGKVIRTVNTTNKQASLQPFSK